MSIINGYVVINENSKYLTEDFIWINKEDFKRINWSPHVFTESELEIFLMVDTTAWKFPPHSKQSATYDTSEMKVALVGSPEKFEGEVE